MSDKKHCDLCGVVLEAENRLAAHVTVLYKDSTVMVDCSVRGKTFDKEANRWSRAEVCVVCHVGVVTKMQEELLRSKMYKVAAIAQQREGTGASGSS